MKQERAAGGVVVRQAQDQTWEFLLIDDRYGKVSFAKGRMEAGETIEQTALREIEEETGIIGEIKGFLQTQKYVYTLPERGTVDKQVDYFLVLAIGGEVAVQVEEIDAVHWCNAEEAWMRQTANGYENNATLLTEAFLQLGIAARWIDHTLLRPDARSADIEKLCREAVEHGFYSVCVQSGYVAKAKECLQDSNVKIAAVCGFPHGVQVTEAKVAEAARSADAGAEEIDMVLNIGALLDGEYDAVEQDIAAVVQAVAGRAAVKVIFETGYLNETQIEEACRRSVAAGAAFVKTSTGFGPGGATVAQIKLMRETVGDACGVKASGGVRDFEAMLAMVAAGANRIGTSSGIAIVSGSTAVTKTGAY